MADITKAEIQEFLRSNVWQALKLELEERREMIVNLLIKGDDKEWTDDNMRGRISELKYLQTTPDAMLGDLEIQNEELEKNLDSANKETSYDG